MADTKLILGGITFREFEIPDEINYGLKQKLEVHKLVGGGRVIDAYGPDPDPIRWQGRFRGADARSRARQIEALAGSGKAVSLSWGGYSYTVLVDSFDANYQRFYEIPYRISCTVDTGGYTGTSTGGSASRTEIVSADLTAIASIVAGL